MSLWELERQGWVLDARTNFRTSTNSRASSLSLAYTELACSSSVLKATINGAPHTSSFITGLGPTGAVKLTTLPYNMTTANGVEVCLTLRLPCNSLDTLCPGGVCSTSFYSSELRLQGD